MEPSIEIISEPSELGEGPFWDKITQSLYFVDILKSAIHKYVPKTGVLTSAKVGDKSVSIIIPIKDQINRFLISYGPDLATITWDGKSENISDLEIIAEIDPRRTNRLNDGKISPHGAVFVGSMATEKVDGKYDTHKGSFYCYTNNQIVELIPDVSISNGLAWTPDGSKLYYIDTFRFAVTRFDCDVTKRPILSNETIVYKHSIEGAVLNGPDGMTIDNEGKLWIAIFGLSSSQVRRIDPDTGEIISTVTLPLSPNVTSVTFGGADLDELFVTSAYCDLSEEERKENPNAGCLFKITGLGVRGTENLPFELKR